MGFRFKKSFKAGPIRTTISKSGISTSFGIKGTRITKTANGKTRTTTSIPGTGISYAKEISRKSNRKGSTVAKTSISTGSSVRMTLGFLAFILLIVAVIVLAFGSDKCIIFFVFSGLCALFAKKRKKKLNKLNN